MTIPPPTGGSPPSSPTGVAFNPHSGAGSSVFDLVPGNTNTSAVFLFDTEDGTISGWNQNVSPSMATLVVNNSAAGALYTGLAVADNGGSTFLYAANFHSGQVEVYSQVFAPAGSFTDSSLPADYAPYNITNIGGNLYVTYAQQDAARQSPVPGLGRGFVDVFSPAGKLLSRLASNAPLDEPWGVALAPSDFGQYSGDLLVANHGDGQIDAFDPTTGAFVGPFLDVNGQAITIDGLRGLSFGNGATAGASNVLFFTAGPAGGTQGLVGSLTPQVLVSQGPDTTQAMGTVAILEAALKASVVNVSAVEGNPFVGVVANFTDDNPFSQPGDFTATINWGDGSTPSAGQAIRGQRRGRVPGGGQWQPGSYLYRRDRLAGPSPAVQHLGDDLGDRRRRLRVGRRVCQRGRCLARLGHRRSTRAGPYSRVTRWPPRRSRWPPSWTTIRWPRRRITSPTASRARP